MSERDFVILEYLAIPEKMAVEKLKERQEASASKKHFDTSEIENSLPAAPKKVKNLTTSEDIIAQAQKMPFSKWLLGLWAQRVWFTRGG